MANTFKLTRRELQVAELIAWGASKKEVPDLLPVKPGREPIAIRTVENTVRNIYEKLGIQKVNELSAWYFCTHHNISFDLSPLKRKIAAFCFFNDNNTCRVLFIYRFCEACNFQGYTSQGWPLWQKKE